MKVTLRPIAVLLLAGAAAPGWAQGYPNKPVRILVGYAPAAAPTSWRARSAPS